MEDNPLGEEAHESARHAKAVRAGAFKWVGPNPFSASRTRVARLERTVEIARNIRRPFPRLRHVDGEMETDGRDCFTIPRSERSSECPRDRGLLDLNPTALIRARQRGRD